MKNHLLIMSLVPFFMGCNMGKVKNKDLSLSNIKFVELTFPKNVNCAISLRLDSTHLHSFAKTLMNRKETFVNPASCYLIHIELRNGGSVNYLTDGVNFQGLDDSSDLPFSFKTDINILKTLFNLDRIDSCN